MSEERDYWQRRVSRRRVLRGAALSGAGLAAAAVIGCGEEEKPAAAPTATRAPAATAAPASPAATPTPAAKQPKKGGSLVLPSRSDVFQGGLDPHIQQASQTGEMRLFYQTLVRANPRTFDLEPELAQKWEVPSQTELIFRLAPGVKWHNKPPANGRELTVQDIVFSLDRVQTKDPKFINRSLIESVQKVEGVDKSTVKITLKQPDVTTLNNLGGFPIAILAPEVVEKADKFASADSAVGTGAFVLQSKDNVSAVLVRNPGYWKEGLPYLDGVRLQLIKEIQARWAAFLAKQLDTAYVPGPEAAKVFAEQQGKPYAVEWFSDSGFIGIQANTERKPFDDRRVTRALRLLVDHQEAVDNQATFNGRGYLTVAWGPFLANWDFTEQEYLTKFLEFKRPKDEATKEALALLNAAGFTKDNPVKFELESLSVSPTGTREAAELLQSQFRRLSQGAVQVTKLDLHDQPTSRTALGNRDFDYFCTNLAPGQPTEPDSWFQTFHRTKGSRNYGSYSDPKLDGLIEKQRAIFDLQQRKAAVKEILQYLIDNSPYTSWAGRYTPNVRTVRMQNWAPEGNSAVWGYQYEQVWLDA